MLIKDFSLKLLRRYNIFHFLNIFLFVICAIFSVVDISSHIRNYYQYQVIVNTKLEFNSEIYIPSISLCFPTIVDEERLRLKHPEVHAKIMQYFKEHDQSYSNYEWRSILATNLTIGQIRLITANFKNLFISCMFRTNQDKFVDCDRFIPIQQQFSLNHNCFILFEQDEREISKRVDQFNFNPEIAFDYALINKTDTPNDQQTKTRLIREKTQYNEFFRYKHGQIKNKDWIRIVVNKTKFWNGWVDFGISSKGRFYEMFHGQPNFLCISTDVVNSVSVYH